MTQARQVPKGTGKGKGQLLKGSNTIEQSLWAEGFSQGDVFFIGNFVIVVGIRILQGLITGFGIDKASDLKHIGVKVGAGDRTEKEGQEYSPRHAHASSSRDTNKWMDEKGRESAVL